MLNNITGVVRDILLLNIILFFGTLFLGEETVFSLSVYYPTSDYFKPYQIVTHMFMHANFGHLFFNMIGLIFFGPILEMRFGPKRFFIFYMIAGLGALALYLFTKYLDINYFAESNAIGLINSPMLGASGAVFALLAGFATLYPNQKIHLLFPPVALKSKYFIGIYIFIELFLGLGPIQTGIAHFAHLGGALFGFLLIKYWRYK